MKKRTILETLGDFVLGKGFYIVLFLCVATIGISGYYFLRSMNSELEVTEPVTGNPTVVLPDSEANGPDPAGSLTPDTDLDEDAANTGEVTEPDQQTEADPDAQSRTEAEEPADESSGPVVYTWPVKGEILRDFSAETLSLDPTLGDWRTHGGVDIASTLGVEVLALCSGTVSEVYDDGLMGTTVVIDHGNGLSAAYCNLAGQPTVESGDVVETGTIIGTVGDTAIAESGMPAHLHLEVSLNGILVDPTEYLPDL